MRKKEIFSKIFDRFKKVNKRKDIEMTQFMIPVNDDLVEEVARAIAKNRFSQEMRESIDQAFGNNKFLIDQIEESIGPVFETLWNGENSSDEKQREIYREEARAVIRAINLKLLITA